MGLLSVSSQISSLSNKYSGREHSHPSRAQRHRPHRTDARMCSRSLASSFASTCHIFRRQLSSLSRCALACLLGTGKLICIGILLVTIIIVVCVCACPLSFQGKGGAIDPVTCTFSRRTLFSLRVDLVAVKQKSFFVSIQHTLLCMLSRIW